MKKILSFLCIVALLLAAAPASSQEIRQWKLPDLKLAIENAKGPTIFNFWATFCIPCLHEIPAFEALRKKYDSAGVKLVLVSLDMKEAYPKKIREVAGKKKIVSQIVFLDETNADLFCPAVDPKWSGAIPATLFVNPKTGYRSFFEEELTKEKLEAEIVKMLR